MSFLRFILLSLVFFPQAFCSLSSKTRETFARQRNRGLTDKSYINFQDASRTLKNMQTTLFTRQSVREQRVFWFLSEQRWGPLGESDIHSNTIRPTIDRSC